VGIFAQPLMRDILHVLASGHPSNTGMARIVIALAAQLPKDRFRLHAWFLSEDGPLENDLRAAGVLTRVVRWRGGKRDPLGALRFCRNLRRQRFAIVHQHVGGKSVRWAVRGASDARTVVHVHGRVNELGNSAPELMEIHGADARIAVSEAVARYVRGGRVDVVYPGTVAGESTPVPRGSEFVIGSACRLESIKGIAYLLEAFASLRGNYRLEIAGSGSQQEELMQLARRLGVEHKVRFLGWQSDLCKLMARWHVYVQPSLDEGFGLAALEAMAAGLTVIATQAGGLAELVRNGETGILVPPQQSRALAEAIAVVERDEELRLRLGRAAHRRALTHFNTHAMSEQIGAIYSRVLASSSKGV
jgi:glycosyltransferase involved in cell wall biosynthesis